MTEINTRIATSKDLQGVLDLQKANLYSELSEEGRRKGFVTTPFTEQQILDIISLDGLFVAEQEEKIVAYVFAGEWHYFEQWPIFPHMTSRFSDLQFRDQSITTKETFQYGPICIDVAFRGQGVMQQVFEEMRLCWVQKFQTSITFINQINKVSTRAHEKLGWEIVDTFDFNGNEYFGLAFDMKKSVL